MGPLPTAADPTTGECTAPSSQIRYRKFLLEGSWMRDQHVTSAGMGATATQKGQE